MATRLLIIHRQLIFAVTIKQALEQTGLFDVHPFTTPDAAFDYLRDHPQDVALVDFTLPNAPGVRVVQELRAIQPDIAVIVTPDHPDAASVQVQGIIDAPFTARDLVPVIQQVAAQATAPEPPQTRRAAPSRPPVSDEFVPPPSGTRILGSEPPRPPDTTHPVGDAPPKSGKTRIFDDQPDFVPPSAKTHIFDDEPASPSPAQTRHLDEEPQAPAGTHMLDDDQPELPPTKQPVRTRHLEAAEPEPPAELPEFSSLDSVLQSFDFEPMTDEEDTRSVPERDSDAVRQYLATTPDAEPYTFDEILGAIEPEEEPQGPRQRSDFEELVESMRGGDPHKPLPERQQKSLDFILTSGMDQVLKEIEKAKTGPIQESRPATPQPPKEPSRTFKKLAQEEPPMPTLEEDGTVSDLMTGIGDTSFRNVLAMLRGEGEDRAPAPEAPQPRSAAEGDFAAFADRDETIEDAPPRRPPADRTTDWWTYDDDDEESVAHVVLKTTLDQPDSLPLDEVMTEIESRLAAHKLNIRPLPSWDMDTSAFRPLNESGVMEPDFLPEELPPGELLEPPDVPEFPPSDASSRTTQPSSAVQEMFEPPRPESDTAVDVPAVELPGDRISQIEWPAPEFDEAEAFDELPVDWLPETEAAPDVEAPPETAPEAVFAGLETELEAEWPFADEAALQPEETAPERDAIGDYGDWTLPEGLGAAEPVADEAADWTPSEDVPPVEPEVEMAAEERSGWTPPQGMSPVEPELEVEAAEPHDPYIAQLALNLTQASLELTAEGTLLTRDGEIVAAAGHLAPEDTAELLHFITTQDESPAEGARFRFVSLPSSGKDYMLYSIQTTGSLLLSMIFAGTTPLRVIRRQAHKLVEALESVPEVQLVEVQPVEAVAPEPEPLPPPPVEPVVTNAYACVWLLRDPDDYLSDAVAQSIIAGLSIQLQEQGWLIHTLQVHEDFVYLLADVPGERPPHDIIRELKRRSADIAHAQNPDLTPQMLWADSYLVLTPGRELQTEEILEFINFQRML
ncbi:MAG: transposase [Chloroflexi bacterium]|nr:transposase [Chloroflexota bacterium]